MVLSLYTLCTCGKESSKLHAELSKPVQSVYFRPSTFNTVSFRRAESTFQHYCRTVGCCMLLPVSLLHVFNFFAAFDFIFFETMLLLILFADSCLGAKIHDTPLQQITCILLYNISDLLERSIMHCPRGRESANKKLKASKNSKHATQIPHIHHYAERTILP